MRQHSDCLSSLADASVETESKHAYYLMVSFLAVVWVYVADFDHSGNIGHINEVTPHQPG